MSDEITPPALSPQEWKLFHLWKAGKLLGGKVPVYGAVSEWSPRAKHAAAAQCLYGQPFGFTKEEVDELELALDPEDPRLHSAVRTVAKLRALLPVNIDMA